MHLSGLGIASGSGEVLLGCNPHVVLVCDVAGGHDCCHGISDHLIGLGELSEDIVVDLGSYLTAEVLGGHIGGHGGVGTVEEVGIRSLGVVCSGGHLGETSGHDRVASAEGRRHETCIEVLLSIRCIDVCTCDIGEHAGVDG